ncbi:hypothetical protein EUTSA_v10027559mg, partial [Eutrema salsugineum]
GRIELALDQKAENTTVLEQWRQQQQRKNQLNPSLICNLIPEDFTARFYLIHNVFGLEKAEKFFKTILENLRSESIYSSLLSRYARRNNLEKPNEESSIKLNTLALNRALRVYADVSDIATMEEFLSGEATTTLLDWLTRLDMAKAYLKDGLKGLMRLFVEAGETKDFYRIWNLVKIAGKPDNEGIGALIGSPLKLDDIKGAEEIYYNEWACSDLVFDIRVPTMLASAYREKGMVEKADNLLNTTMRSKGFDYSFYSTLLTSYTRSNKTLDKANDVFQKMDDLGFLMQQASPFSSMISLYSQKEPDGLTMNNVYEMYADETNIVSMEKGV